MTINKFQKVVYELELPSDITTALLTALDGSTIMSEDTFKNVLKIIIDDNVIHQREVCDDCGFRDESDHIDAPVPI